MNGDTGLEDSSRLGQPAFSFREKCQLLHRQLMSVKSHRPCLWQIASSVSQRKRDRMQAVFRPELLLSYPTTFYLYLQVFIRVFNITNLRSLCPWLAQTTLPLLRMLKQNHQCHEVLGIFNCSLKSTSTSTNSGFLAAKAVRFLFLVQKLIILGFKYLGISPMIAVN